MTVKVAYIDVKSEQFLIGASTVTLLEGWVT
jgi:hypothetical protein